MISLVWITSWSDERGEQKQVEERQSLNRGQRRDAKWARNG